MLRISRLLCVCYLLFAVVVVVLTAFAAPLGSAPFPLPLGPEREPVVVSIAYGTEKEAWLQEATRRFLDTNPAIRGRPVMIELQDLGSHEIVTSIVQGEIMPVVASPASSIQIELLRSEWEARTGSSIFLEGSDAPQPLVLTPLVLVAWENRANVLWSGSPTNFWNDIHDALANPQGWQALGGDPNWGLVKFGHTSPESSNSGIQILVLLAYAYHQKSSGLTSQDILDTDFQQWLTDIERAVLEFGDSTGTFMTDMVRFGPSKYDFVVVYENLAIENIAAAENRWSQSIRVYYPPATIVSDHPYAILNAEWVTPEQQEAAARFRDFLLSAEIQRLALQFGFRPANIQVSFDTPDSPFNTYADYGIQKDIPSVVDVPSADVLTTLLDFWQRQGFEE